MGKIVGVGSLIVDIAAFTDHFPVAGETTLGKTLKFGPGGKGNNQMTAAHRAGAEAVIIGRVGKDWLGELMRAHYRNEGMTDRYIKVSDHSETGSALIEVESAGQNRIIIVKGACAEITAQDVREAESEFADCDLVITQLETSIESILECKNLAKKYGKPFLLNPAPFQEIPDDLFKETDWLTPNETEAELFTGIPVRDPASAAAAAAKLLDFGVKHAVITLGEKGVFYSDGTKQIHLPCVKVQTVDTTGAGDAFNGAFAVGIAEKMEIETALKFANCCAALSTTKHGTAPAMPTRSEILDMLKQNYGNNVLK